MSTYREGMTAEPAEVLVVGAGPTGLAMTALLHHHGIRVRIIDRNPDRAHESRALAIQPRTLEVLAPLGVNGKLIQLGNRNVALRLHAPNRTVSVPMFDLGLSDCAYPFLLFLSQAETERILAEHLAAQGITVEHGSELVSLQQHSDHVIATVRHRDGSTEHVTAKYAVGCDGAHSTVRELAGIGFEGSTYRQTFVLADTDADGIEPGTAHVFLSGDGMLFFFPLVTPAAWRLLAMRPKSDPTPPGTPVTLAEVQTLADAYTAGVVQLRDPVWMTNFRLHHRAAATYRKGRVLIAGDAAHVHSPAGAQGMNTGIQDAANLAWKLAHTLTGVGPPSIVDTYETERAPIGRAVLRMADRGFTIATSTSPLIRFARNRIAPAVIPLGVKLGAARGYLWRTVGQLRISYRRSPLSAPDSGWRWRGLRAGDRLPDAPLPTTNTANERPATLHELVAAPSWHLLLCGPGWPAQLPEPAFRRAGIVAVHHLDGPRSELALYRLGVKPGRQAMFLIRPDGHIGLRSNGTSLRPLLSYLDRWLPAGA